MSYRRTGSPLNGAGVGAVPRGDESDGVEQRKGRVPDRPLQRFPGPRQSGKERKMRSVPWFRQLIYVHASWRVRAHLRMGRRNRIDHRSGTIKWLPSYVPLSPQAVAISRGWAEMAAPSNWTKWGYDNNDGDVCCADQPAHVQQLAGGARFGFFRSSARNAPPQAELSRVDAHTKSISTR